MIGELTSLFYRNGYNGAVLLQSTLQEHQYDVWDRIMTTKPSRKDTAKYLDNFTILPYCEETLSKQVLRTTRRDWMGYAAIILYLITQSQNIWEWFAARMY